MSNTELPSQKRFTPFKDFCDIIEVVTQGVLSPQELADRAKALDIQKRKNRGELITDKESTFMRDVLTATGEKIMAAIGVPPMSFDEE
ncbi:MAG: hypothetical protein V2A63_00100 [Patescibacteria group bacterium]